ncbi:MAG: hypothetical protein ACO3VQ_06280 [Ilumatobacteraceae bacterium]
MAFEAAQIKVGNFTASADLSAKQYHFVKMSGNNTVTVCAAITDVPIGVLQNAPASGGAAEVCLFGISKVVADGTLAAGNVIGTSADGQADAITAGTDTTVYTMGIALSAASAGETVQAFINATAGRAA